MAHPEPEFSRHTAAASEDREGPWTILSALRWTTGYFTRRGMESARLDAELLLAHALGVTRLDLYLRHDQPLSRDEMKGYKALILRRAVREPAAYILGKKEFWSMDMNVTPDVLIPRPETECLVEEAIRRMDGLKKNGPQKILELGTGCGAAILALARERPGNLYFASERSQKALIVARENAKRHGQDHAVSFFAGDWLLPLSPAARFDCILSNPPYVPTEILRQLAPEISKHEPAPALDGGQDGLAALFAIIRTVAGHLFSGAWLVLEIGHDQRGRVEQIASDAGAYENFACSTDYSGHDRVFAMQKK